MKVRRRKKEIEFPPFLCNKKCPKKTEKGYQLSAQSYISIPPGTKIGIYVNKDPNDIESDCEWVDVVVVSREHVSAVTTQRLSVREEYED